MPDRIQVTQPHETADADSPTSQPCVLLVFGASGDLTRRLLVPALYNLACDGLLAEQFAVLGAAMDPLTTESFRARLSEDIKKFHTRHAFDPAVWDGLVRRFHYLPAGFADLDAFEALKTEVARLGAQYRTGGNVLFYFATAPRFFGLICGQLHRAGLQDGPGWKRIIVEKPFGTDLASARELNRDVLAHWQEDQIYRVDHYLGKETVQNLLAFRFSNGMFEPLWNKHFIDNIQFNVAEAVDVEGRGGYYDGAGVLRDMMQNHMFQMLAYLCMEVPGSFDSHAIRNEKAKLLEAVRVYTPAEVARYAVRGQYGPQLDDTGVVVKPGYRQEKDVAPQSKTETFAAARLHIDNWRWEGVPIYLRSGKALWKRGTEIIVEFKKAPQVLFRNTPVQSLGANRLIFHIQPYQGIEIQFQAKIPGPALRLQPVNMRFGYGDAFKASRYTGYEVMLYSCTHGDATLFSRGDLVEAAWRIAQPILDYWDAAPADFPNYARGTWGPAAASGLIERDGRRWFELITDDVLKKVDIFKDGDPLFLSQVILALRPEVASAGELLICKDDMGKEMYVVVRGEVEVLDDAGQVVATLRDGACFGEIALLTHTPRTATVRARTGCDLLALDQAAFSRILHDHPHFAESVLTIARERYNLNIGAETLLRGASRV
ncbi:MAG TPA: glucose-6-phosphate dehydrogenase [Methylomirabilota bacterium]|nr:glucose-6-phosphate dehydrogenase [Methylomirabilota bacterium]